MILKRQSKIKASEEMIVENNAFEIAEEKIRSAIDALGEIAKDDKLARDCIANLSVVLLDIKASGDEVGVPEEPEEAPEPEEESEEEKEEEETK